MKSRLSQGLHFNARRQTGKWMRIVLGGNKGFALVLRTNPREVEVGDQLEDCWNK